MTIENVKSQDLQSELASWRLRKGDDSSNLKTGAGLRPQKSWRFSLSAINVRKKLMSRFKGH